MIVFVRGIRCRFPHGSVQLPECLVVFGQAGINRFLDLRLVEVQGILEFLLQRGNNRIQLFGNDIPVLCKLLADMGNAVPVSLINQLYELSCPFIPFFCDIRELAIGNFIDFADTLAYTHCRSRQLLSHHAGRLIDRAGRFISHCADPGIHFADKFAGVFSIRVIRGMQYIQRLPGLSVDLLDGFYLRPVYASKRAASCSRHACLYLRQQRIQLAHGRLFQAVQLFGEFCIRFVELPVRFNSLRTDIVLEQTDLLVNFHQNIRQTVVEPVQHFLAAPPELPGYHHGYLFNGLNHVRAFFLDFALGFVGDRAHGILLYNATARVWVDRRP